MAENNVNSRKVRIMRAGSFLSRSQGKDVDTYFQEAIQEVGSYFESSSSKRVGSGMTINEEKLLMLHLVGVQPIDREYLEKRDLYFKTMSTKVPFKDGVELETGLTDNTKTLSADNLPISVADYVRYRQISAHPWVGKSEDSAKGNQLLRFYIFDAIREAGTEDKENDDRDVAVAYYLKLKDTPEKVDMLLTLLGKDPREVVGQNDEHTTQLRKVELRKMVDASPSKVVKLSKDKLFEIKYNIQSMVNSGTLKVIGTRYIITETDEPIGDYEATVDFFRDEKNAQTIALLKAKNQEAQKADKRVKRTMNAN